MKACPGVFVRIWLVLFCLIQVAEAQVHSRIIQDGVAIIKAPVQSDRFAAAHRFIEIVPTGPIVDISLGGGRTLRVARGDVVRIAEFENVGWCDLFPPKAVEFLQTKKALFEAMGTQYPNSAPLFSQALADIQASLQNLADGQVRIQGAWLSQAEYQGRIAAAERERMAQEEAYRAQQRANEMVLQEAERKKEAEARQLRQLEENARRHSAIQVGGALLEIYRTMRADLADEAVNALESAAVHPLADAFAYSMQLPPVAGHETYLHEGAGGDTPGGAGRDGVAGISCVNGHNMMFACVGVTLRYRADEIDNGDDVKAFHAVVRKISPEVAEWLPLGLACVRAKLEKSSEATVESVMGKYNCELASSRPRIDGAAAMQGGLFLTLTQKD